VGRQTVVQRRVSLPQVPAEFHVGGRTIQAGSHPYCALSGDVLK
jgi:hypothetical protein